MTLIENSSTAAYLRIGFVGCGVICISAGSALYETANPTISWLTSLLMLVCYLAGFACLALAATPPQRSRRFASLIPLALGFVVAGHVAIRLTQIAQYPPLTTDVQMFVDHAARLLLDGQNPYRADLSGAYRINQASLSLMTPLADGSFTGRLAYPALSVLLFLPLKALGINTGWTFLAAFLAAIALLYLWAPRHLRPVVVLPFFIDPRYFQYSAGGVSDSVWALLLLLMVRFWHRKTAAAILFGLAASFKQQPWLLAPLLLLRLWHENDAPQQRKRQIARFIGLSIATFFVINAPFFAWDPMAWMRGVFEPAIAPMITFGQGLSSLSATDMLGLAKSTHSLLMLLVYGFGVWLYAKQGARLVALMWLVPGFALFFGNRSLTSYWYFYAIPFLADIARQSISRQDSVSDKAPAEASAPGELRPIAGALAHTKRLVPFFSVALLLFGLTIWQAHKRRPLDIELVPPFRANGPMVRGLSVVVRNRSGNPITPRFATKSGSAQPYFWKIVAGPQRLRSGEMARYRLQATSTWTEFDMRRGARLIVSDAASQSTRAGIAIRPDTSFLRPDGIPNGRFFFWDSQQRPTFWGLAVKSSGARLELVIPEKTDQRERPARALRFALPAGTSRRALVLDTYIALPTGAIEVTLKLPKDANRLPNPSLLYGLRVLADHQHVWILFGDRKARGSLPTGERFVMVPSPRQRWSKKRIDLEPLLRQLGLPLVARRVRVARFEYLDAPIVPLNFQLAVSAGPAQTAAKELFFGPVRMIEPRADKERLYQRLRRRPQDLHRWLAAINLEQRNYAVAIDHYRAATKLDPRDAHAWLGLAESHFWLKRFEGAIAAYGQVVSLEPKQALAFKGIGWSCYALGRVNEAVMAWKRAERLLRKQPAATARAHLADTLKGMGLAQLRLGSCQKAREHFEAARTLEPTIALPRSELAACRQRARAPDGAR